MSKRLTPEQWAAQYKEAWKAICEGTAAVMPIDCVNREPYHNRPYQTKTRNLAMRLDWPTKRKPQKLHL